MSSSPEDTGHRSSGSACSVADQWGVIHRSINSDEWKPTPDAPLERRVAEVFVRIINPELARDGGSVELVEVDADRVARIRLKGSCQGCASSAIRLSMILEPTVKSFVPEIRFLEVIP